MAPKITRRPAIRPPSPVLETFLENARKADAWKIALREREVLALESIAKSLAVLAKPPNVDLENEVRALFGEPPLPPVKSY